MIHQAVLLPGIVLPAELAYPALIEALGAGVEARAKELEVYARRWRTAASLEKGQLVSRA